MAVSACLLGEPVRYDGTDKYLATVPQLANALSLLPVCPELGAGLGVPRPPVRLIAAPDGLRARGRDDPELDVTAALSRFAKDSCAQLRRQEVVGYLFKSRSPSCGLGSTPVTDTAGCELPTANGLQAAAISTAMPWLVMREESQLQTSVEVAQFIWLCRWMAELRQAGGKELPELLHHYRLPASGLAVAGDGLAESALTRLHLAMAQQLRTGQPRT